MDTADNVEIVRRSYADAEDSPEAIRANVKEFWDGDADYYPARKFPESRPCHGPEDVAAFLVRLRDGWSHVEVELRDVIDIGGDRVLVCAAMSAVGHSSEMTLAGDLYQCIWLRGGRFLRVEDHLTESGALRAFGLEAETLETAGLRG